MDDEEGKGEGCDDNYDFDDWFITIIVVIIMLIMMFMDDDDTCDEDDEPKGRPDDPLGDGVVHDWELAWGGNNDDDDDVDDDDDENTIMIAW